jgi:hypothetical protein
MAEAPLPHKAQALTRPLGGPISATNPKHIYRRRAAVNGQPPAGD